MNRRNFIKGSAGVIGFGLFNIISKGATISSDFDLIIRDGLILDGTGKDGFFADVGITGEKITSIGNLKAARAARIIKAEGRAVAPGFIDIHAHSEDELLVNPKAESKIRQGVTTEILGQDGESVAPLNQEMQTKLNDRYQDRYGISVDWTGFPSYFNKLSQQGTAVNVGSMVGQGTLREFVVGMSDRPASSSEIDKMKALTAAALREGAFGISSGLEYTPGGFAATEELIELCKAMPSATGIYATHMRDEADSVVEALDEAIAIAKGAGVALHIAHLKCMGERNWGKLDTVFERIQTAKSQGLAITADRYPYTAYNTDLSSLFPIWAREGTTEQFLERLQNSAVLPRIKQATLNKVDMIGSWESVMITSVESEKNRYLLGKKISEVIGNEGADSFDFVRKLIIEENNRVAMCGFAMSEENTVRILTHPLCMISSDASAKADYGVLSRSNPHPRTFGTFPRVLGKYVRDDHRLTLTEAIRKMTSLPATTLGLSNRGQIQNNFYADLVVFDPEKIRDRATFTKPHQYPEGIGYVLVNGTVVIENESHTGELAGKILKRIHNQ